MTSKKIRRAVRYALLGRAAVTLGMPVQAAETITEVVVTGSRIQRQDYVANSPLTTISEDQITQNADVTLDTVLNSLPQVSPAGSTASNNPPNSGQSNVDLRGLGSNRNLVLIDGRRPMVSSSEQEVDLNTIPQALIESIEVITGGAGAAYGADAVAGVVNIKLKNNFEGIDLRSTYSNTTEERDAQDMQFSLVLGGNFSENRGNAVIAFDYSEREPLIKGQRPFSAIATSTTTAIPEGIYRPGPNLPAAASVNALFAGYGTSGTVLASQGLGFNADGSLFSIGSFNSPVDSLNFRYPIDLNVNTRFYPDFYSYNFDAVNLLVLPLERRSLMSKFNYAIGERVEAFASLGWTEYDSTTALAPTPVPSGTFKNASAPPPGAPLTATNVQTSLVAPGRSAGTGYIVPLSNPFIPADLRALLATRTGDNLDLAGAGASEPFFIGYRTLTAGLRESNYQNSVVQALAGLKGDITDTWSWEVSYFEGRTEIDRLATGNIDNQKFQNALEAPDGGASLCAGGINPFGRGKLSKSCADYLSVTGATKEEFLLQVGQGFVTGEVATLPAGAVSVVLGGEYRGFRYEYDPGQLNGPISGFTTAIPALGRNSFSDVFTEALIPIVRDAPGAKSLELSLGYRYSDSEFKDLEDDLEGGSTDDTYKVELSWEPLEYLRARTSFQHSVRAPNFEELFDGNNDFPQFFDPCTSRGDARNSSRGAQLRQLCIDTGLVAASADTFVPLPGGQFGLDQGGNTRLSPESADTITVGLVFQSPWSGALEGLRGSIDYFNVQIDDPILTDNVNLILADCYNYWGTNPTYDANRRSCRAVETVRGGSGGSLNNGTMEDPDSADGIFPGINGGSIETDGIDLAVDYGIGIGPGRLNTSLFVSYLLSFKQKDRPDYAEIDYAGTIAFFGEGLSDGGGASAPELKANLTAAYSIGAFTFDTRARFIDGMDNRASVIFPGESSFTGVPSVTYWDLGVNWRFMEKSVIRLGVNNIFEKEPPLYAPNQQSGTDPSLYDVVGRRFFGQVKMQF
jgi:iron complex outermembrane recepter protein